MVRFEGEDGKAKLVGGAYVDGVMNLKDTLTRLSNRLMSRPTIYRNDLEDYSSI
jgi:predicted transcriptional regulator YheO